MLNKRLLYATAFASGVYFGIGYLMEKYQISEKDAWKVVIKSYSNATRKLVGK